MGLVFLVLFIVGIVVMGNAMLETIAENGLFGGCLIIIVSLWIFFTVLGWIFS
jgi:hypothetical protein